MLEFESVQISRTDHARSVMQVTTVVIRASVKWAAADIM